MKRFAKNQTASPSLIQRVFCARLLDDSVFIFLFYFTFAFFELDRSRGSGDIASSYNPQLRDILPVMLLLSRMTLGPLFETLCLVAFKNTLGGWLCGAGWAPIHPGESSRRMDLAKRPLIEFFIPSALAILFLIGLLSCRMELQWAIGAAIGILSLLLALQAVQVVRKPSSPGLIDSLSNTRRVCGGAIILPPSQDPSSLGHHGVRRDPRPRF